MSSSSSSIAVRGWVVICAVFAALLVPIALTAMGLTDYDEDSGGDPYRPADRGLADRICLVVETMIPACLIVGPAALFRARHAAIFEDEERGGRGVPLV